MYRFTIKPQNKVEKPSTTGEIIGKQTEVSSDGIVEINGVFRACIHVSQINMRTNADIEKYQVWAAYRSFLNEIGMPYTLLQLSQFLDIREYATWYEMELEANNLTPELKKSGEEVVKFINNIDEDKKSRDYDGYIIFHYNPSADSISSGVLTGNPQLDGLLKKLTGRKSISQQEKIDLSHQILSEAVNIACSYAEQMGMSCYKLNKAQIYNMSYKILQKDYSAFSGVEEASEAQCFTPFHESLTKRTIQVELRQSP